LEEDGLPWDQLRGLSHADREALIAQHLQRWQQAWRDAAADWYAGPDSLGNRGFPVGQAFVVRMNDFDVHDARMQTLADQLYALAPEAAEELLRRPDRSDFLYIEEDAALNVPRAERTEEQRRRVAYAVPRLTLAHELAEIVPAEHRIEARRLADEALLEANKVNVIERLMMPVRFLGWRMRVQAEAEPEAVNTYRLLAEAEYAHRRGTLLRAKQHYEQAFGEWKKLLDKHPGMMDEVTTSHDMIDHIDAYRRLVEDDLDGEFPKNFVLQNVLDIHLPGSDAEQNFKKRAG
jgi:hypothetical protein